MSTTKAAYPLCALCKQPVEIAGFCLLTAEGEKHFCCEGCLCVYQLLNETPPHNSLKTITKFFKRSK